MGFRHSIPLSKRRGSKQAGAIAKQEGIMQPLGNGPRNQEMNSIPVKFEPPMYIGLNVMKKLRGCVVNKNKVR
jgi:hypothetical protein